MALTASRLEPSNRAPRSGARESSLRRQDQDEQEVEEVEEVCTTEKEREKKKEKRGLRTTSRFSAQGRKGASTYCTYDGACPGRKHVSVFAFLVFDASDGMMISWVSVIHYTMYMCYLYHAVGEVAKFAEYTRMGRLKGTSSGSV